jgi:hypothetical protein
MPTLTFYVGERPVDPVIWDTGRDLTGLTPSLVGDTLPAATVVVHDAAAGQVAISFTAPFTQVGVFTVQVRLARGTGEADLTDTVQFRVLDPAQTGAFTVINPGSVEGITGQSVSGPNVLQAQSLISLLVDRDLTDATVLAAINARDTALLRQAIAWQAASANGSVLDMHIPTGATGVSTGDLSLSFGGVGITAFTSLDPVAKLALSKLSWMGTRSIHFSRARRGPLSPLVSDRHAWVGM